jgi:hypothetical protein
VWQEIFQCWTNKCQLIIVIVNVIKNLFILPKVLFEEPELDGRLGVFQYAHHHNADETLVQMSRSQRKDVEFIFIVFTRLGCEGTGDGIPQSGVIIVIVS